MGGTASLTRLLALGAAAGALLATAATAGVAMHDSIHDEGEFTIADFCDEPGLNVDLRYVMDISVHAAPHGPGALLYFLQHGTRTEWITNPANGKSVRSVANVIEKDQRVTDNGDGTLTIIDLATGNAFVYGQDGKAIARNPGQTVFRLFIDDGGTPNDPSDDEILDQQVVKESTGRSDDFCAAVVPVLR
jgi:hypothetical protein